MVTESGSRSLTFAPTSRPRARRSLLQLRPRHGLGPDACTSAGRVRTPAADRGDRARLCRGGRGGLLRATSPRQEPVGHLPVARHGCSCGWQTTGVPGLVLRHRLGGGQSRAPPGLVADRVGGRHCRSRDHRGTDPAWNGDRWEPAAAPAAPGRPGRRPWRRRQHHGDLDDGATADAGADRQGGAEPGGALAHDLQAVAVVTAGPQPGPSSCHPRNARGGSTRQVTHRFSAGSACARWSRPPARSAAARSPPRSAAGGGLVQRQVHVRSEPVPTCGRSRTALRRARWPAARRCAGRRSTAGAR